MGFIRKVLLALLVALAAYYMYNPLPTNIEQPVLYSVVVTVLRIIEDMAKVSELFGYKELLVFRRYALVIIGSLLSSLNDKHSDINITDTTFDGVPVRVYMNSDGVQEELNAGFVFIHGGGFVMGRVASCDSYLGRIVKATGVTVVSIEYRLGPENPSPAQLEDCQAVTQYFFANAESWGVDPRRIGVGGASAGGNMAAVLSLRNRDRADGAQFAYQVLIYPWVQALNFNLPSYKENDIYNSPDMKQHGMALFTLGYLGVDRKYAAKLTRNHHVSLATLAQYHSFYNMENLYGALDQPTGNLKRNIDLSNEDLQPEDTELADMMNQLITNPDNFPLMAKSVANVPPAIVMTMGLDTLRDEGLLYLRRLRLAGVNTEHYHDDICWHGALKFNAGLLKFDCGDRLVLGIIKYIQKYNNNASKE